MVEGVLYRLADEHELLKLDVYEGTPIFYSRERMPIDTQHGPIGAWLYIANPVWRNEGLAPSRAYLEHLLAGRHYLSDSVYRINDALGAEVITSEADTLRLDSALLPCDLVEFQAAVAAGDDAAAAGLYAGPLMDGFFMPDSPEFER